MARTNKYAQGFADGVAAAEEFIRSHSLKCHRENKAQPWQFAEWLVAANALRAAKLEPVETSSETTADIEPAPRTGTKPPAISTTK